jgi:sugar-specific transcriptional regulator TrmB
METMWVIRGQSAILRKVHEMMSKARGNVEIISTEEMLLPVYKKCNKIFDQLSVRKVRVRVRIPSDSLNSYFIRELKYICSIEKVNTWSRMVFISIDQQEFLLAKLADREEADSEGNNVAVYSNNVIFCNMVSTLLSDIIGKVRLLSKARKEALSR